MTEPESNWKQATELMKRQRIEASLACPKCQETNRGKANLITLDDKGVASCDVCGTAWHPQELK